MPRTCGAPRRSTALGGRPCWTGSRGATGSPTGSRSSPRPPDCTCARCWAIPPSTTWRWPETLRAQASSSSRCPSGTWNSRPATGSRSASAAYPSRASRPPWLCCGTSSARWSRDTPPTDDGELRRERDDPEHEDHRDGEAQAQVVGADRAGEDGAQQRSDVVELVEARHDLIG